MSSEPHFLYRVTASDERVYLGVSKNPRERLRRGHHSDKKSALYGLTNLRLDILACGSREYIYQLEDRAIIAFNTRWPNGLNKSAGGFGGRTDPLPSTRAKLSAGHKGQRAWNKGVPMSAADRAKLATAMKNSPLVLAAQVKATAAAAAKPVWNKGKKTGPQKYQRVVPPELRARLAAANTNNPRVQAALAKAIAKLTGKKLSTESIAKRENTKAINRMCS